MVDENTRSKQEVIWLILESFLRFLVNVISRPYISVWLQLDSSTNLTELARYLSSVNALNSPNFKPLDIYWYV